MKCLNKLDGGSSPCPTTPLPPSCPTNSPILEDNWNLESMDSYIGKLWPYSNIPSDSPPSDPYLDRSTRRVLFPETMRQRTSTKTRPMLWERDLNMDPDHEKDLVDAIGKRLSNQQSLETSMLLIPESWYFN